MAGRRLRDAVKTVLTSEEYFEFDDIHIVIAGLTNTYSQYITTYEEYQVQRYEVSCKRHEIAANISHFLDFHSKNKCNIGENLFLVIQILNQIILLCIDKTDGNWKQTLSFLACLKICSCFCHR